MLTQCRANEIDFATESTKGTKDCRNGFFVAVAVFFVVKKPFGRQLAVSDSAGAVVRADGRAGCRKIQSDSKRFKVFQSVSNQKKKS